MYKIKRKYYTTLYSYSCNYEVCQIMCHLVSNELCICLKYRNKERVKVNSKKSHLRYRKILRDLKVNGCAICGYNKCTNALEFHHVNPEDKEFTINRNAMHKVSTILVEELNKTILLCSNCHREIEESN